jgi:hypothetical protein
MGAGTGVAGVPNGIAVWIPAAGDEGERART